MAKARSPGYPAIGLREAIEKIRRVYEKDYQNKIPRKIVAEHMGYQSLNGKSLGVLSAVAKFGLIEGRGDENWVSDLGLKIIAHEPGSPERGAAIAEAAKRPELFAELDGKFPGGRASDGAIRSYLLTMKFIPQAADAALRAYRETQGLVSEEGAVYSPETETISEAEAAPMMQSGTAAPVARPLVAPPTAPGLPSERELLRGPLSRDASYRLMVSGNVGPKELGKIIKLLTLQAELYSDDGAEEADAAEPKE